MAKDFSLCPEKAATEIYTIQFRMQCAEHHLDNSKEYLQLLEAFEPVRQVWDSYRKVTDFTKGFLRKMSFFSQMCGHLPFS